LEREEEEEEVVEEEESSRARAAGGEVSSLRCLQRVPALLLLLLRLPGAVDAPSEQVAIVL